MEKTLSVHQKKASKQPKATKNKKQLKVVYISNPMKVETSPSEFRALVQGLTGQDADFPDESKFQARPSVGACGRKGGGQQGVPDGTRVVEDHSSEVGLHHGSDVPESSDLSSEAGPDYVPQLIEDLPGLMPSNMWYD